MAYTSESGATPDVSPWGYLCEFTATPLSLLETAPWFLGRLQS